MNESIIISTKKLYTSTQVLYSHVDHLFINSQYLEKYVSGNYSWTIQCIKFGSRSEMCSFLHIVVTYVIIVSVYVQLSVICPGFNSSCLTNPHTMYLFNLSCVIIPSHFVLLVFDPP